MRNFVLVSVAALFGMGAWGTEIDHNDKTLDGLRVAQDFVAAFNNHDVDAMTTLVAEDVEWLNLRGSTISVETKGRSAMAERMKGYFASTPSVQSTIASSMVSGSYVALQERVTWTRGSREATQAALSVYEIKRGKIQRVWYYPAEK